MKHWHRGTLSLVAVLVLLVSSLSFASAAAAGIEICEAVFPDPVFRNYVARFDADKDGFLDYDETHGVESIEINNSKVKSLKGIEHFHMLLELECYNNQLTELDVSKNVWLEWLDCRNNQLTSIDLSQNTEIYGFRCDSNKLTSLDLSKNPMLEYLDCCENKLTSLDLSKNTFLTNLYCENEQLTSLNISACPYLSIVYCSENKLTALDVSRNPMLVLLVCEKNQLASIDVSNNTYLQALNVEGSPLTMLDVSKNTALDELYVGSTKLSTLDVSKNTALTHLGCEALNLTTLDVSHNPELTHLYCFENKLTSLDLSHNPKLEWLTASDNQFSAIDVSHNPKLKVLFVDGNKLTSLNVSRNTALERLYCYRNQLTSLDLSQNAKLSRLDCERNRISALDISSCPELVKLLQEVAPKRPGYWTRGQDGDVDPISLLADADVKIITDKAQTEKLTAYVERCYQIILGRGADEGGRSTWVNELNSGRKAAAELIEQFVASAEFRNKNLSNADAVEILYKAMLGRGSDPAGKADWVAKLDAGQHLTAVINGFSGSAEFKAICDSYGINPGTVAVQENPGAANEKIKAYVERCYQIILGRGADEGGLSTWVNELNSGRKAAAEIIEQFVASAEFQNKKLSNNDSVEILYKAMLGRGSDPAGKASWVEKLDAGQDLTAVINGFCGSAEFKTICDSYGIQPGTVTVKQPTAPAANDEKIRAFVARCYKIILGRDADEGGMNTWAGELSARRKAAAEIIEAFVNSQEFQNKKYSNADAVEILYKAMLGRGSDAAGKADWVSKLNNGQPLTAVINGFCGSGEFKAICDAYGITPGTVKVENVSKAAEETAETVAPKTEKKANLVEITNASDTVNENLGTAVQAIYINEEKAKEFIGRCYQAILGREAGAEELNGWIGQMMNGSKTADQIARGFLFSGEFKGRNIGNEELVKILYRVYMNREADAEGLATWTQKLDEGTSLNDLLNVFAKTGEFKNVVRAMGE